MNEDEQQASVQIRFQFSKAHYASEKSEVEDCAGQGANSQSSVNIIAGITWTTWIYMGCSCGSRLEICGTSHV